MFPVFRGRAAGGCRTRVRVVPSLLGNGIVVVVVVVIWCFPPIIRNCHDRDFQQQCSSSLFILPTHLLSADPTMVHPARSTWCSDPFSHHRRGDGPHQQRMLTKANQFFSKGAPVPVKHRFHFGLNHSNNKASLNLGRQPRIVVRRGFRLAR